MRWSLFLFSIALLAGVATGCGKRETPVSAGVRTQTLHLGNNAEVSDFDPHVANSLTDYNVLIGLFEGLTVLDETTAKPVPGVAESWNVSQDGLVYTFRIRPNVFWSNGDPVTAGDFAFSIQRVLSPKIACPYANLLDPLKGAKAYYQGQTSDFSTVGVRVVDASTLELTLVKPAAYFLDILGHQALFPVHRGSLEKHGNPFERNPAWTKPTEIVGNGAFVVAEWSPDQKLTLKKNPRYYGAATNRMEGVVFYPISSAKVEEANFRTGLLHVTYDLLPDRLETFRRERPNEVRVDPLSESYFLRFNVSKAPFTDKRVRQALSKTIDRKAIADSVMRGSRAPANFLTPPNTAGYTSRARVEYDPDAARRLLAEAGFPEGRNFPRVEVQMNTDAINGPVFEAIQAMWKRELGIDVGLVQLDPRVYLSNQQNVSYDMTRSRWVADYNDPSTYIELFITSSGNNQTSWSNAEYDQLADRAARELDPEKRYALLQEAEALLLEEAPIAPIFFGTRTYLISENVKGWVPALLGIRRYQTLRLE